MLALHGLGASHRYWGRSLEPLAPEATVLSLDLLGFGGSPKPAGRYGIERHLDAIEDALERQRVGERLIVVGHSFGALLGLAAATRWPGRVVGVVAVSLPAYPSSEVARRHIASLNPMTWLWVRMPALARPLCELSRSLGPLGRILAPLAAPELPPAVARDGLHHSWDSYRGSLEALIEEADVRAWITNCRAEVIVLQGAEDRTSPVKVIRLVLDDLGVTVESVAGVGHQLPLRRPEVVLRAIRALQSLATPGHPPKN